MYGITHAGTEDEDQELRRVHINRLFRATILKWSK